MAQPQQRDPANVRPGWYWYYVHPDTTEAYHAFWQAHRDVLRVRGGFKDDTGSGAQIVVFELLSPGVRWEGLPGLPGPAPRGINTNLSDIAKSEAPQPGLVSLVENLTGKAWDDVKAGKKAISDTAKSANTAVNVLVWAGAAILAYNLFVATRPSGAA